VSGERTDVDLASVGDDASVVLAIVEGFTAFIVDEIGVCFGSHDA